MNRIGIFGGTFDPPHRGHLAIAKQAMKQLSLQTVYFIPACTPPHKQCNTIIKANQRYRMLQLAVAGQKGYKISKIEMRRRGISYTIDTLEAFKDKFPKSKLVLIIGADNLSQFYAWRSPEKILKIASLAVYKRKGFNRVFLSKKIPFIRLSGKSYPISSTDIRKRLAKGSTISGLLTKPVFDYIDHHSLYISNKNQTLKRQHEINCTY
jgi:nicotinate-nucleotide adenylyltransferase